MRFLLLWFCSFSTYAESQAQIVYRGLADVRDSGSGLYVLPKPYNAVERNEWRQDLMLRIDHDGYRASLSYYFEHTAKFRDNTARAVLNELFIDSSTISIDWTVGKKVLSWGTGYAFRPLDVIQQEQRLADIPRDLEGVPLMAAEYFDNAFNASWVIFNRNLQSDLHSQDYTSAFKLYNNFERFEVTGVSTIDQKRRIAAGLGINGVIGDAITWHASALGQTHSQRLIRNSSAAIIAATDPFESQEKGRALKIAAGSTYAFENGVTLYMETWLDQTAHTPSEWQEFRKLTQQQLALLPLGVDEAAVYYNVLWNARFYQSSNLAQKNVLLRLDYNGEAIGPSIDLIWMPDHDSLVARAGLQYRASQWLQIVASYRALTGRTGSLLADAPVEQTIIGGIVITIGR